VVNIITKTPEERILQLDAGVESYNTGVYKLLYGDKTGKLDFLFSVQKSKSDGYVSNLYTVKEYIGKSAATATVTGWEKTKDKYGDTCYLVGDKGNNWMENDHYNLKLGYELSPEAKLGLQFYYKDYNYGYKNGESYLIDTATGNVIQPAVGESTVVEISPGGTKLKVYGTGFESSYGGGPGYGSTLSYDQELTERVTIGTKLGWDTYDHWYADAYDNYSTTVYNRLWTGLQSTIDLTDKHILTTGLDWRDEDVNCEKWELSDWKDVKSKTTLNLEMSGKVNSWGIYLQDEWKILENLSLFSGGRYDKWGTSDGKNSYWNSATDSYISESFSSNSEDSFNPKLAAVYKPKEKTTLRSSIGTAFRGPEATNLYKDWYYYGKLYRGNPELKPEKNQAWEIGIDQKLWKGAKGGITYFDNRMDDYICRRTLTDSEVDEYNSTYGTSYDYEKITQYDNVAEAKSAGVEIGLEQKLPAGFSIFTNWTYNETEVLKNPANPDSVGKHLTYVPENIFNTGLNYTKEFAKKRKLSVSLTGRYEDKVYTKDDNSDIYDGAYGGYEDYFVADFKLTYAFGKNYELMFTVDNLFDEEYYQYYKSPGRTFGLMTRIKF
ncbi:MAG: TonB-dependent receptor, partial [Candidatus Omnitrophica bacterium]|nr:TonB-dependent receptor [Candidatus Omnitrophota bacterium]